MKGRALPSWLNQAAGIVKKKKPAKVSKGKPVQLNSANAQMGSPLSMGRKKKPTYKGKMSN